MHPNTKGKPSAGVGRPPRVARKVARSVIPRLTWTLLLASVVSAVSSVPGERLPYPPLALVERALLTTAKLDFTGEERALYAATLWNGERLRASQDNEHAPHLACAKYSHCRKAVALLEELLSPGEVRRVSHSSTHGSCFVVTASHSEAAAMLADPAQFELTSFGPFPSALKISPGLLEHGDVRDEAKDAPVRLTTTHGSMMRMDSVEGLNVELSPGTLPPHDMEADTFIQNLLEDLMSESLDLHSSNVWSDPAMMDSDHLTNPGGALRGREWSRAAAVVHKLSSEGRTSPGDICSWHSITAHHSAGDLLLVSGVCILLSSVLQFVIM